MHTRFGVLGTKACFDSADIPLAFAQNDGSLSCIHVLLYIISLDLLIHRSYLKSSSSSKVGSPVVVVVVVVVVIDSGPAWL